MTRDYDFVLCFATTVAGYSASASYSGTGTIFNGSFCTSDAWHWIRVAPNGVKHDAWVGYAAGCKKDGVISMARESSPPNNSGFRLICFYIQ